MSFPDEEPRRSPATGRLADLARAGYLGLPRPSMRVEFEIHHVVDGPGRLLGILDGAAGGLAETLSAGGNGVGVVVGTRLAEHPAQGVWSPLHLQPGTTRQSFHGSARPNPTFQHATADRFEAVVCIEDEPRRVTLRHGFALRDLLHEVSEVSLREQAPLVSLQCPAQIPPHTSRRVVGATTTRAVDSSRSSSLAMRFSMALARPRAAARLRIADRLAAFCRERGLGLWLADTRAGYHDGDWFIVSRHDRSTARARYDTRPGGRHGASAEGCLPVTLVGPARLGAVHAVAAFLARCPDAGVLACSMTPLDDLAFVHLQLAVHRASRGRLTGINRVLTEGPSGGGPADVLPHILGDLLGCPPADPVPGTVLADAEDYQVVVGPALPVVADTTTVRLPAWFSWTMRARPSGDGLRTIVGTFTEALASLGLGGEDQAAPSIEYLVCRQVGPSRLKGKGKLGVPRALVDARFPASRATAPTGRMCNALESAWRARLAAAPGGEDVLALSVSWRESWLGHWT
ncbi:hypothetical protein [Pseudonocardia sp.]|uniref:hypothetical protein n=1 Tax=Pseudonocardia sp. TaxID=60912 RepID=UPI003D0B6330